MTKNSIEITKIKKRSGEIVKFDASRIEKAVEKAFKEVGQDSNGFVKEISRHVESDLKKIKKFSTDKNFIPHVEMIQDLVEEELMKNDFTKAAKAFILYRQKRADVRKINKDIPEHVQKLTDESKKYFEDTKKYMELILKKTINPKTKLSKNLFLNFFLYKKV